MQAAPSLKFLDTESENTTECAGDGCSREEDSHTFCLHAPRIPQRDVKGDTREEASLGEAEEDARAGWTLVGCLSVNRELERT